MKVAGLEYATKITSPGGVIIGDWISVEGRNLYKDKSRMATVNNSVTTLIFTLTPSPTGSARIETTTDPLSVVKDDIDNGTNNTIAIPWPNGDVSVQTQEICLAITAFRMVVISGTMHLSVRGNH